MKITGMFIAGDVHLSRKTIKEILKRDFDDSIKSIETAEGHKAVKRYITDLIYRLDHLEI